ncbi:MAG: 23S rRNA (cytosine1962-C5)-methyltransferase [Planctomycetota bacterium]
MIPNSLLRIVATHGIRQYIPPTMANKLVLKPRMAKPFWHGEPWVFDGSIVRQKGYQSKDGEFVELRDQEGRRVGAGFYNSQSVIRIRLLAFGADERSPQEILTQRIEEAVELRYSKIGFDPEETTAMRLVHAEGDGIPGLIVDRYGDWLVMQIDCLGLIRHEEFLANLLLEKTSAQGIYRRVSKMARDEEGSTLEDGLILGELPPGEVEIRENGIRYLVDFVNGQKTGFYTDQRINRQTFARFCKGAKVLDAFSYSGAFGLNALIHGGAKHVTAIDSSARAIETLGRNAELNGVTEIDAIQGNVLRVLDHESKSGPRFDIVSLDPPKLVPKKAALRRGMKLYREINEKGIKVLNPGGILATCSCSGSVSELDFENLVRDAAVNCGRRLQLLNRGAQGADHPERVPHRASSYLKFRLYRVL